MNSGEQRETRIMVVDDEERGVELMARALRKLGSVTTITVPGEALEVLRNTSFALVISDQRMPGMTGVELLAQLASFSPHTGRVLLTGFADLAATKAAINEAKVHAYLSKPCPPDQLRTVASNVILRVQLSEQNEFLVSKLREQADELEEVIASLKKEAAMRVERARVETAKEVLVEMNRLLPDVQHELDRRSQAPCSDSNEVRAWRTLAGIRNALRRITGQ